MKTKAYPQVEPHVRLKNGNLGPQFKGSVVCMLDHNETSFLNSIMESILSNIPEADAEEFEQEFDLFMSILESGTKRMNRFHEFMGAFDVGDNGKLTKPESEKIDWDKYPDIKHVNDSKVIPFRS